MNSISLAALYMGVLATCTPAMGCTQYDVPFAADRCYENVGANIASGCLRIAAVSYTHLTLPTKA